MDRPKPDSYGPAVARLLHEERLAELGPGRPNAQARDVLGKLRASDLFPQGLVADQRMAMACLAGLWLYHDFLDESHRLSQEIPTTTGSYWHGIMHRREPDFGNGKYWFRRVGDHPVFPSLSNAAREIHASFGPEFESSDAKGLVDQPRWDPFLFVDLCESAIRAPSDLQMFCRRVQEAEWWLLFDHSYRAAGGQ